VEGDASPIKSKDVEKLPVFLAERKASKDLLEEQASRFGVFVSKAAPLYKRAVSPVRSPNRPLKATKFVNIQSNPSTGFIGMSLVAFEDRRVRIGGTSPKGPCASVDIQPGDVIISIDGEVVDELSISTVASMLTSKVGQWMKLGLHVDDRLDYSDMRASQSSREVWLEQGEAVSIGVHLTTSRVGGRTATRIAGFWLANSSAQYSALQVGDVLFQVNGDDVTGSSFSETLAAIVLTTTPVLTVYHDSSLGSASDTLHEGGEADARSLSDGRSDVSEAQLGLRASLLVWPGGANSFQEMLCRDGGRDLKIVSLVHDNKGKFGLDISNNRIEKVIPDSPAERNGRIKSGDRILMVNHIQTQDSSNEEVLAALKAAHTVDLLLEENDRTGVSRQLTSMLKVAKIKDPNGNGLGLKIKTDYSKQCARISEVIKGKKAAQTKKVKIGDRIVSANGVYLIGKSHEEIIEVMHRRDADGFCILELQRDTSKLHNPELRKKVILRRSAGEGIGLKIHSAAQDYGVSLGARISEVIESSPASRHKSIKVGDWLIRANGINLEKLAHDDIVKALKSIRSSKISFELEEDNSPIDDVEEDHDAEIMPDILSNHRWIDVPRNPDNGLLGFEFYTDRGKPWTRVHENNLSPNLVKLGMRPDDVLVQIGKVWVLRKGHDTVREALQGSSEFVSILLAEAPLNGPVFPRTSLFQAPGMGIQCLSPRRHHLVVSAVSAGSPADLAGVLMGDFIFGVSGLQIPCASSTDLAEAVVKSLDGKDSEVQFIYGRTRPTYEIRLPRGSIGERDLCAVYGFDAVFVPHDPSGHHDDAGTVVVTKLSEGIGKSRGLQQGDVISAINGVSMTSLDSLKHALLPQDVEITNDDIVMTIIRQAVIPRPGTTLVRNSTTESFGMGLRSYHRKAGAFISTVVPGSPADTAGLRAGQKVVRIDEEEIDVRSHEEVLSMIKRAGTTLKLELAFELGDVDVGLRYLKSVQVQQELTGYGMKIVTKEDGKSFPRISHINAYGVVGRSGVVEYGDRIIRANNKTMAGITSQDAVDILIRSKILVMDLLADPGEMYQVIVRAGPPPVPEEVLRQDWYVGDMPTVECKMHTARGQCGSFLVRLKRPDASAFTLLIQDRESKVKMYGIKWNPRDGKYIFGERYTYSNLLEVVKHLRDMGIPIAGNRKLHLFDPALHYKEWYVMDTDTNFTDLSVHVASAEPGQFLVRQRPRDKGTYILCARLLNDSARGQTVLLKAVWSKDRGMYEVSEGMRHIFNVVSICSLVDSCVLSGIQVGGHTVKLTEAASGYVPAAPGENAPVVLAVQGGKPAPAPDSKAMKDLETTASSKEPVVVDAMKEAQLAAQQAAAEAAAAAAIASEGLAFLPDLPPDDSSDDSFDVDDEDLPPLPEESDDEELPLLPEASASAVDDDEEDLPDLPDLPPPPPGDDDDDDDDDLPPLPEMHEVNLQHHLNFDDDTEV